MESIATWHALAEALSGNKSILDRQIAQTEKVLENLQDSLQKARDKLLQLLASEEVSLEELNLQEHHVLLLGKLLIRKRAALLKAAMEEALKWLVEATPSPELDLLLHSAEELLLSTKYEGTELAQLAKELLAQLQKFKAKAATATPVRKRAKAC